MAKNKSKEEAKNHITRRDVLKGIAAVPVLGLFTYDFWKKQALEKARKKVAQLDLGLSSDAPSILPSSSVGSSEKIVRIGIIGLGGRGRSLLQSAGFMVPEEYKDLLEKANSDDKGAKSKMERYYNQDVLNIQVIGMFENIHIKSLFLRISQTPTLPVYIGSPVQVSTNEISNRHITDGQYSLMRKLKKDSLKKQAFPC